MRGLRTLALLTMTGLQAGAAFAAPPTDKFCWGVIGDPQHFAQAGARANGVYPEAMDFYLRHRAALDIKFVITLGDVAQDVYHEHDLYPALGTEAQAQVDEATINGHWKLDGVLPYHAAWGNHDCGAPNPGDPANPAWENETCRWWYDLLGPGHIGSAAPACSVAANCAKRAEPWFVGESADGRSMATRHHVGNGHFVLVISTGWGGGTFSDRVWPEDKAWTLSQAQAYPDDTVVVVSHAYDIAEPAPFVADYIAQPNIKFAFSGHWDVRDPTPTPASQYLEIPLAASPARDIFYLRANPQVYPRHGGAWVGLLCFNPAQDLYSWQWCNAVGDVCPLDGDWHDPNDVATSEADRIGHYDWSNGEISTPPTPLGSIYRSSATDVGFPVPDRPRGGWLESQNCVVALHTGRADLHNACFARGATAYEQERLVAGSDEIFAEAITWNRDETWPDGTPDDVEPIYVDWSRSKAVLGHHPDQVMDPLTICFWYQQGEAVESGEILASFYDATAGRGWKMHGADDTTFEFRVGSSAAQTLEFDSGSEHFLCGRWGSSAAHSSGAAELFDFASLLASGASGAVFDDPGSAHGLEFGGDDVDGDETLGGHTLDFLVLNAFLDENQMRWIARCGARGTADAATRLASYPQLAGSILGGGPLGQDTCSTGIPAAPSAFLYLLALGCSGMIVAVMLRNAGSDT